MLAPRAVKRKACPPVATSEPPKAPAAETAAEDSVDGAEDIDHMQDRPVLAGEADTMAEGGTNMGSLQDGQDATDMYSTGQKDDKEEQDRARVLQRLLVAVEEAVSDWGLSLQNHELLVKLQSSADGCEDQAQARALCCQTWAAADRPDMRHLSRAFFQSLAGTEHCCSCGQHSGHYGGAAGHTLVSDRSEF